MKPHSSAIPWIAAGVVGGLALLFTGRRPTPYLPPGLDISDVDESPTLTRQGARLIADSIFAAIYGDGSFLAGQTTENEDAVIAALMQCMNDADVLLVIDAYGIRGGSWSLAGQLTLPAAVLEYLSASDRQRLNRGLAAKGIQLQF